MGSWLNVHCMKTASEEGGTIPALEKATAFEELLRASSPLPADEGQQSSARLGVVLGLLFFVAVGSGCHGNRHLMFQKAAHLTHLWKGMVTRWHMFGECRENQIESLTLVQQNQSAWKPGQV